VASDDLLNSEAIFEHELLAAKAQADFSCALMTAGLTHPEEIRRAPRRATVPRLVRRVLAVCTIRPRRSPRARRSRRTTARRATRASSSRGGSDPPPSSPPPRSQYIADPQRRGQS
jgi:hypothetical protein